MVPLRSTVVQFLGELVSNLDGYSIICLIVYSIVCDLFGVDRLGLVFASGAAYCIYTEFDNIPYSSSLYACIAQ